MNMYLSPRLFDNRLLPSRQANARTGDVANSLKHYSCKFGCVLCPTYEKKYIRITTNFYFSKAKRSSSTAPTGQKGNLVNKAVQERSRPRFHSCNLRSKKSNIELR